MTVLFLSLIHCLGVSCATHPIGDLLIGHDKKDVGGAVYASEGI